MEKSVLSKVRLDSDTKKNLGIKDKVYGAIVFIFFVFIELMKYCVGVFKFIIFFIRLNFYLKRLCIH